MPLVRKAESRDLYALGRMGAGMIALHHNFDAARFFSVENPEDGYAWWLGKEIDNPDSLVMVAEDDAGSVVGYSYSTIEEADWSLLLGPHGGLHDLWIEEIARRSGLGKQLAIATLSELKNMGASQIVLSTASHNIAAIEFWKSIGFRATMVELTKEI